MQFSVAVAITNFSTSSPLRLGRSFSKWIKSLFVSPSKTPYVHYKDDEYGLDGMFFIYKSGLYESLHP
jgi:hypothetical protein